MLTELWVSNLAVVERLTARFRPGLNVLTGETGAGKSLVVGALELVLGGRGSAEVVRSGAREAEVVASFELDPDHFRRRGIDQGVEERTLILRRVVGADGRSRGYVNDRPVTVGRLRELGGVLADLHGQHEHQSLLREDRHLEYLDGFAGSESGAAKVRQSHEAYFEALRLLEEFQRASRRSADERELLRFQLEELEGAKLRPGEEEDLTREHRRVVHAGRLLEAAGGALESLSQGDPDAVGLLARASRLLEQGGELDPELDGLRRQVDEAMVAAEETARELGTYVDRLGLDPARAEEIETRLDLLSRLCRKHNVSADKLIARREELQERLDELEDAPLRREELEARVRAAGKELVSAARVLTATRGRAAASLSRRVSRELTALGMSGARFSVELRPPRRSVTPLGSSHRVGPRGAEDAVFQLAANPGEPAGDLARIASGGEVSRVMLALKNVLRRIDPVPVLVFDEVDAGIGGLVAEAVGSRLATLAGERQVLVVTHLAVIAGRADHHLCLSKKTGKKRTRIGLEEVTGVAREKELARMLTGTAGGEDARRTARTLLSEENRK